MKYEKLSPTLASAFERFQADDRPGLLERQNLLGLVTVEEGIKPPRAMVFLHMDESAPADAWADLGVEVNQPAGAVRTALVPLAALDRLTEDPVVARIVPSQPLRLLMDKAAPKIGIPAFRKAKKLTGKGVIVGVVDSGIDVGNPHFGNRVLRIWDQTLSGPGVTEGAYGLEVTGAMLATSRDKRGHGTHVAGIAAGADPTFTGVAPEADVVFVKTDMQSAHIADGVRYCFRVAAEMGRPAVVNLSLGGHGDGHDGTDSLSMIIDAEVGPGRIVCCAAGNEGTDNVHATVKVPKGGTRTIPFAVQKPMPNGPPVEAVINGWYKGSDKMEVAVVTPTGAQTPFQAIITSGSPSRTYTMPHGTIEILTPGPDPANGDVNFFVIVTLSPTPPATGTQSWRVRLKAVKATSATGRVDAWSVDLDTASFTGSPVEDAMKVGAPAASTQAVTVGSFTTKIAWEDIFGNPHEAGFELDDITDFSSEGPRRDGVQKPDVVAPGAIIVSALSVHAGNPQSLIVDDSNKVDAGTSMACPFVAGIVALLLQRKPTLDPAGVKALLKKNSKIPGKTAGTWDRKWGYGLISAKKL